MSFCPICKCNHNPNAPCHDVSERILQDMSKDSGIRRLKGNFKQVAKKADKFMFKFFMISTIIIVGSILLLMIIPKLF